MRVVNLAADGASSALTFPIATLPDPMDDGRLGWNAVVPDAEGRWIVTGDAGLHLRDGATGELIATLAEGDERLPARYLADARVRFLADGRIVVGGGPDGTQAKPPYASLQVFDPTGVKLGETRLDSWPGGLTVGPEVARGRVAVSSFRSPYLAEDTLVVDVAEGRVVERLPGLRPAMGFFWNVSAVPTDTGPTSVHYVRDVEGRVIRIDFATGERKIVAGPGAPRGERISAR
jgi:sugar lactone lactonase YvrE